MLIRLHVFLYGLVIFGMAGRSALGDDALDFEKDILPLFEEKCIRCHGGKKKGGKLDMRTLDSLFSGGVTGPAIKQGNAPKSLLIELIHYKEMPPKEEGPFVTDEEQQLLRRWIDAMPLDAASKPPQIEDLKKSDAR
ncbi:MAG: hypothetical protein ACI8UO_005912 [Verrucomicrobiales bacterium]|jgi:hypothetical protein